VKDRAAWPPGDGGVSGLVERLHHHTIGGIQEQPFAGAEHMVFAVALTGQPDAAGQYRQFPGALPDTTGLPRQQPLAKGIQGRQRGHVRLRIHHQSP
jgi:hypothetical protein